MVANSTGPWMANPPHTGSFLRGDVYFKPRVSALRYPLFSVQSLLCLHSTEVQRRSLETAWLDLSNDASRLSAPIEFTLTLFTVTHLDTPYTCSSYSWTHCIEMEQISKERAGPELRNAASPIRTVHIHTRHTCTSLRKVLQYSDSWFLVELVMKSLSLHRVAQIKANSRIYPGDGRTCLSVWQSLVR